MRTRVVSLILALMGSSPPTTMQVPHPEVGDPGGTAGGTTGFLTSAASGLRGGGVDDRLHRRDAIRGKSTLTGVLANHVLVRREVNTVDPVVGDVAVNPL